MTTASGPIVTLYTRQGCPLCSTAHELLMRFGLTVNLIDIDSDSELLSRYNECVPVVFIDGKERFRGPINEILLRRLVKKSVWR